MRKYLFVTLFFTTLFAQGKYSENINNFTVSSAVKWITPVNGIPENTVIGDVSDGKIFYVARGYHRGKYHPGKTERFLGACLIGYKGREIKVLNYQVLVFTSGKSQISDISSEVNREILNLLYKVSDELNEDKFSIFVKEKKVNEYRKIFVKMRKAAIKKSDKRLTKKLDQLINDMKGAFIKIDDLKMRLEKIEELL